MKMIKRRSDLHLMRKSWHFSGVLFIIIAFHNLSRPDALTYIAIASLFALVIEFSRFRFKNFNRAVQKVLAPVLRTNEMNSFSGLTAMLIGCWIAIWVFPKSIVTLSLYFLATADPIASYFGLKYGKDKLIGPKTLQGTIAAFLICFILSLSYYYARDLMQDRLLIASLLSGLAGALSELIAIKKLDDNFTIPVFGSLALWGIFYVFGGFIN